MTPACFPRFNEIKFIGRDVCSLLVFASLVYNFVECNKSSGLEKVLKSSEISIR